MVAAVALFAAASCNKELPQEEVPAVGETVVYTASTDGADTKAALNETTKKSEWVADDAITVHDGEKGWTFTAAEAGANVDFSNSEGFGEYRPVLAVYPAGTYTVDVAAKTAKAYIPTWQQAQAGTYHSPAALAVAYTEDNTFAFKNAHALLKFTVNTDNVTHVIFHGNGSEAITGDVNVTLGEDGVESVECLETVFTSEKWNEETQQKEQVSETKYGTWVECYAYHDDANKYFAKDRTYYIAVAPQKFEGGVTVRVRINDGEELVAKTTTNPVETKINTILNLGEIKYEAPVVHEWAVAGTFNGWSTTANPMELVDGYYVAKNITGLNYTAPTGEETGSSTGIKFVNNGDTWRAGEGQVTAGTWAYVWGDGGNIYVDGATADTAYDIYLNPSEGDYGKFVIVAAGAEMPEDVVVEEEVLVDYWAVVGSMLDNWASEVKMTADGDWYVAEGIELTAADEFKFRANGDANWTINRGAEGDADGVVIADNVETTVIQGGKNFAVATDGVYSLYINKYANKVKVVRTGDIVVVEPGTTTPGEDSEWAVYAQFGSETWSEVMMKTTTREGLFVVENKTMNAYNKLLIKKYNDTAWKVKYGSYDVNYIKADRYFAVALNGGDIYVEAAGTYDIYFDYTNTKVYLMSAGSDYASATEQIESGDAPVVESGTWLYLKPNSNWLQSNARFAVYTWDGGDQWFDMKDSDSDGIYEVLIPEGISNIIFCRMNPGASANGWGNKWNQTSNLKVPTDGTNLYTVKDGTWDNGGGTWSVK